MTVAMMNKTTNNNSSSEEEEEEMGSSLLLAEDEKKGPSLGFILGRFSEHALVGLLQSFFQERQLLALG